MLKTTLRLLTTVTCLTFALGVQAFALPQLWQPKSVVVDAMQAIEPMVETDKKVTPVGCLDNCCGSENASSKAVCCPKRVTVDVKKHCWKVECKQNCIPGFRFQCNWKKRCKKGCDCGDTCCTSGTGCDCPPKYGRIRCIKVLEKHETTCEKCGYEWEVKSVCTGKSGCCSGDCPSCGCAVK